MLALSLVSTGFGLAQPYLSKFLIDDGLLAGRFDVVWQLCLLMVGLGLAAALLGALNRWCYVDVSARLLHALRETAFARLLRQPPDFFQRQRGGDLLTRLDGDLAEIQRFAVDFGLAAVNGGLALIGVLLLMLSLSPLLTAIALVLLPLSMLFLRWIRPRLERTTRRLRERNGDLSAFLVERLTLVKLIQANAAEEREGERLRALNERFRKATLNQQLTGYAAASVPGLIQSLATALVFAVGGYLAVQGRLTVGTLIAFSAYAARAQGPLQTLLGLPVALTRARVSLERVQLLIELAPGVRQSAAPQALVRGRGELRLAGVSFGFGDQLLLDEVDALLPGGAKIALSGLSGAGKTTLIELLARHYDPHNGAILLDGVDLRQLDLVELRRAVAVVGQDALLFNASLLNNIRYAAPEAGPDAIRRAARLARIDDFAKHLPQGYDSPVGPAGGALSGGQRQRISIARALLQNPLVLVLDEATTGLDRQTEIDVLNAVDELFGDRTRIVVSHRPAAALSQAAELTLELRGGKLVEVAGRS